MLNRETVKVFYVKVFSNEEDLYITAYRSRHYSLRTCIQETGELAHLGLISIADDNFHAI